MPWPASRRGRRRWGWRSSGAGASRTSPGPRCCGPGWSGSDGSGGSADGAEALGRLARGVRSACSVAGAAPEGGPFVPHLTLGRFSRAEEATRWMRVLSTYAGPAVGRLRRRGRGVAPAAGPGAPGAARGVGAAPPRRLTPALHPLHTYTGGGIPAGCLAPVAQRIEQEPSNLEVAGSSPAGGALTNTNRDIRPLPRDGLPVVLPVIRSEVLGQIALVALEVTPQVDAGGHRWIGWSLPSERVTAPTGS